MRLILHSEAAAFWVTDTELMPPTCTIRQAGGGKLPHTCGCEAIKCYSESPEADGLRGPAAACAGVLEAATAAARSPSGWADGGGEGRGRGSGSEVEEAEAAVALSVFPLGPLPETSMLKVAAGGSAHQYHRLDPHYHPRPPPGIRTATLINL